MWRVGEFWRRLLFVVRGGRFDRELEAEMQFHLEMAAAEEREAGMGPREAEFAARRRFGNVMWLRERSADAWGWTTAGNVWRDLCIAARSLRRDWGFSSVATLILGIGIAANTAVFSALNGLLLRPLPYPDQERLVYLNESMPDRDGRGISLPDFADWRDRTDAFEAMGAFRRTFAALTGSGEPQRIAGTLATAGVFATFGVAPAVGRPLAPEDEIPGRDPVVVLSHALWLQEYAANPDVVGRSLWLDDERRTIVGVMPPGFDFPRASLFWVPIRAVTSPSERSNHMYQGVARLKPGITIPGARANLALIGRQLADEHSAGDDGGVRQTVVPLREYLVAGAGATFVVLQVAVGFVLLIICASVANLLLARSVARRREMAIRVALGASRWRIVRLLFSESALLVSAGCALGLPLGLLAVRSWVAASPDRAAPWTSFGFDARVAAFVVAVSFVAAVAFGLIPMLQFVRPQPVELLRQAGAGSPVAAAGRARGVLVVAEVALAQVLLVCAGAVIVGLAQLLEVDPGFRPDSILTFRVSLPEARYREPERQTAFMGGLVPELATIPGVDGAAAIMALPLSGRDWGRSVWFEGGSLAPAAQEMLGIAQVATSDYFRVMGVPIVRGRTFLDGEGRPGTPRVVIVNQAMAARIWPDQDPIGRRIRLNSPDADEPWLTVVGVAGDVRHHGLDQSVREGFYVPYGQEPMRSMSLVVRAGADPMAVVGAVRSRVWALDRDLPVSEVRPMTAVVDSWLSQRRQTALLMGVFGVAALVLAWLGVYGVIADSVSRRTREIGIRTALGAATSDIRRLVLSQGMKLAGVGVAVGLAGSIVAARALASALGAAGTVGPAMVGMVSAGLLCVAVLGCYIPARRAATVDPLIALRHE